MVAPRRSPGPGHGGCPWRAGIPAFGPRANAAVIEASKVFSKNPDGQVPHPHRQVSDLYGAGPRPGLHLAPGAPIVVKADGLALGKGRGGGPDGAEAEEAVRSMMDDKVRQAGARVVIEECMTGPRSPCWPSATGSIWSPCPPPRTTSGPFDGNRGPNTGGMGAISPPPNYTPEVARRCMEEIFLPTLAAPQGGGPPLPGRPLLRPDAHPDGPKVVEYNARFGDPECQAVLSLLETDLLDIFLACRNGTLDHLNIRWKDGRPAALCWPPAATPAPTPGSAHHRPGGCRTAGRGFPCGYQTGETTARCSPTAAGAGRHRHRAGSERRDRQRHARGAHPLPGHALPHRHWPGLKPLRPKGCYCWLSNWMLRLVASIRAVLLR